jgi:RNA repair pathway DNA polymerase beta family
MVSLRIKNLESLDPHAVPLPHGTEVTTGADRHTLDGARLVTQGAVGRVVNVSDEGISVFIVGVGTCRYQRSELTPHRMGQLRYAIEREANESALKPCVVLEATVGSRAWGLAHEGSDTDRRGIFLLPFSWTIGLGEAPGTLVSADGSDSYWEFDKAVRQLLRGDPNTLEMLWVPDVRALDPIAEALLAKRDAFASVEVYGTFGRYALSQARKLAQSARLAEHRSVVLAWLRDAPGLSLDSVARRLAEHTHEGGDEGVQRCRQYVKQLYRSMHDQGILPVAEFEALARFAVERSMDFDLPRELRPKNAYNLLRLVASATHWLRTGAPLIRVEGELRERLLQIKRGEIALSQSLAWTEAMAAELDEARAHSVLPKRPDVQTADALVRAAREEAARRWFAMTPGPWGRDAPMPPAVAHEQETRTAEPSA